ncbi:MAG: hypothetical protein J0L82_18725 [Deltaproteobacteria bacterium]|nr:hypothetical protein [Deltaproteobacteria bacterium]
MKKYIFIIWVLLANFSISSKALAEPMDPKKILTEVAAAVKALPIDQRMAYEDLLKDAQLVIPGDSDDGVRLKKIGLLSRTPNPFVCVGMQGGIIAGGMGYKCVSSRLDTFTIFSFGVLPIAELSANLVVGSVIGKLKNGIFPVSFTAGAYYKVGGTVMVADGLLFLGAGAGMGAHLNYGVPSDSMFGGQLEVSID